MLRPYIGLAASQFSADGAIVSIVGGDFPTEYLNMLKIRGHRSVGIGSCKRQENLFGVEVPQRYEFQGHPYHQLNVLADFEPVIPEHYRDAAVVMLGNLPSPLVQLSVIEQMKAPKMIVLDTMNFWMNHTWDELMQVISKVNVMTINDEEARQLTKEYSLVVAAQKIMKMGPEFVVIKKKHGALLFHRKISFCAALPLEKYLIPRVLAILLREVLPAFDQNGGDFFF